MTNENTYNSILQIQVGILDSINSIVSNKALLQSQLTAMQNNAEYTESDVSELQEIIDSINISISEL